MIRSKFRFFSFWALYGLFAIFFFIIMISSFSQYYLGKPFLIEIHVRGSIIESGCIAMLGMLLTGMLFINNASMANVCTDNGTISFKNIITQRSKTFSYNFLDGYVDGTLRLGNAVKVDFDIIYLVKGHKYIATITSFSCSNYDEIKNGLSGLTYLGTRKFTILDIVRVTLGMPVYHN